MRTFPLAWILLIALSGCGGGGQGEADSRSQSSGSLSARFAPEPDPARVGHDSSFILDLTDNGSPATRATVQLATFYKGLGREGPTAACAETAPGRYEARNLSTGMNGAWEARFTVSRSNQPDVQFTFPFRVAK